MKYKIRAYSPSEAERIQKAFFALGGYWINNGKRNSDIRYIDSRGFFLRTCGRITKADKVSTFENAWHKEITLDELEEMAGIQNHEIFTIL